MLQEKYEDEKKRHYNERVLEVENGSFTGRDKMQNGGMSGVNALILHQ